MRAHAKAVGDRLEVLLLLVNAVARTPPPGLMDKGSMSWIHEADDAMVDADGHLRLQIGEFVFLTELRDLRGGIRRLGGRTESCAGRRRIRDVDPNEIVLLLAGIAPGVDAIYF